MGILEGIVIATIVLAGAYVGYHAWQDSLDAPEAEAHMIGAEIYAGSQEYHITPHHPAFVQTEPALIVQA